MVNFKLKLNSVADNSAEILGNAHSGTVGCKNTYQPVHFPYHKDIKGIQ